MLYPKNSEKHLSDSLFKNPTCEYRGTPFWAWNCKLDSDEFKWQIEVFKKMGLGGFHMHVRTGLDTEYLGDEYMQVIRDCVDKAKKEKMLAWLYDEDRWPSGAAGGIVTKEKKYRGRCLLVTPDKRDEDDCRLISCYDIVLDADGFLSSYKRIGEDAPAEGSKWYAYVRLNDPSSWHNGQTYVDTLNKEAIERFIEVTHEAYKREVGEEFGDTVPAIFTDEPQFSRKQVLNNSTDKMNIKLPWTDDVPETYREQYGEDILETLPELFWELPNGRISRARYLYHDHIAERFAESFADTCGSWCRQNGIALTGHMMEEPTLMSQTAALGEAMRSYRGFDIPGIDMLCARFEFTTAKQAQSAAHQFGCPGIMSELYGVTGWDYEFRGYKLHGDWQAALGVTVRVPHLSWASMQGAAKRDYPASIHYQSPWWDQFSVVEDHFGRVNTALTRGKPIVRVGVIHPVESFWLHWGPNDKTAVDRESMDERFSELTKWLLTGSVDFDFICESLLPGQCKSDGAPFRVGEMAYDAVIVPGCETLRSTTLERLEQFSKAGGKLIFMGAAPKYEDAVPSDRGRRLFDASCSIPYERAALLNSLESMRDVTMRFANGRLSHNLIYSLRQDNDCRWFFTSHCTEPYNKDIDGCSDYRFTFRGEYSPVLYDTLTGDISPVNCEYVNGNTVVDVTLYDYDSLLLRLDEGRGAAVATVEEPHFSKAVDIEDVVPFTLSEPNVLLLDMAETSVDGADFIAREELLRADNIWREKLGFVWRGGNSLQPWVIEKKPEVNKLTLRFRFESEIVFDGAMLAVEDAERASIVFNGQPVKNDVTGWYTDKSIKTVALPAILEGQNILDVTIPFGPRSNTEWCYIIGNFGVKAVGRHGIITRLPEKLAFSNAADQGLAFYGGNITYHMDITTADGKLRVCTPHFRGGLVRAALDGKDIGFMAYTPYAVVTDVSSGRHSLDITAYGHRYNSFGAVHNADTMESWHGPSAWETRGTSWSYEYVLKKLGLLSSPVISQE